MDELVATNSFLRSIRESNIDHPETKTTYWWKINCYYYPEELLREKRENLWRDDWMWRKKIYLTDSFEMIELVWDVFVTDVRSTHTSGENPICRSYFPPEGSYNPETKNSSWTDVDLARRSAIDFHLGNPYYKQGNLLDRLEIYKKQVYAKRGVVFNRYEIVKEISCYFNDE